MGKQGDTFSPPLQTGSIQKIWSDLISHPCEYLSIEGLSLLEHSLKGAAESTALQLWGHTGKTADDCVWFQSQNPFDDTDLLFTSVFLFFPSLWSTGWCYSRITDPTFQQQQQRWLLLVAIAKHLARLTPVSWRAKAALQWTGSPISLIPISLLFVMSPYGIHYVGYLNRWKNMLFYSSPFNLTRRWQSLKLDKCLAEG